MTTRFLRSFWRSHRSRLTNLEFAIIMADADTTPSNATPVAEVEQNDTQVIVKKCEPRLSTGLHMTRLTPWSELW